MNIENLTVTDKGETIEAEYILSEGNIRADISQQIRRSDLYWPNSEWSVESVQLNNVVHSYLNQNLK